MIYPELSAASQSLASQIERAKVALGIVSVEARNVDAKRSKLLSQLQGDKGTRVNQALISQVKDVDAEKAKVMAKWQDAKDLIKTLTDKKAAQDSKDRSKMIASQR